jgi:glycosyltransferase involved in cell wall biosynthesis
MSSHLTINDSIIDISIVICSYNRAKILAKTLKSFGTLERPVDTKIELLIIDNNSSDETPQLVNQFIQRNSDVRYIFEPQPGLSHARNRGIKESQGSIVAYVDDDVIFDSAWLIEVVRIFQAYPDASCMGGKIIPQFEVGRPDWAIDEMLVYYGSTSSGDNVKQMLYPEIPFGGNMAFRHNIFNQINIFNPNLGRKKKNLLSNEECEIFWRINQAGLKVIYNPKALIYHQIPPERTCKDFIISRYYWQGISSVAFDQLIAPRSRIALFKDAIRDAWKLMRQFTGGTCSPRKAYWHYKATKLPGKCYEFFSLGRVKQLFIEALTFK